MDCIGIIPENNSEKRIEAVGESLGKIANGAAIVFVGLFTFFFFEFITRVIIARCTTCSEYGTFSIGLVLLNFFVLISCLGLHVGSTRYIAYYRGTGDCGKVKGVIFSAVKLSFIASIACFLLFFFFSDLLAVLFHLQQPSVLRTFAIVIPFAVSIEILASIFRGFDRVQEKVYFRDLLSSILKLVFIIPAIIFGYSILELVYMYITAIVVTSLVFVAYTVKKLPVGINGREPMGKELLSFSLPLLTANALTIVVMQTDTLMLGYFYTTDVVGLYNAAHPLAQLIRIFLISLFFIYVPITTQLYAKNNIDEMRRNYMVLTKWTVSATLPLFLVIFLFPEEVIDVFFGPAYTQGRVALTLQILALGMFLHVFFGPNAATLIVMGKSRLHLINNSAAAIMNVILNLLLIPAYGIVGAAVSSASSIGLISALALLQIYYTHRIHPFKRAYIKSLIIFTLFVCIFYTIINSYYGAVPAFMLIGFGILFFVVFELTLLINKSFDKGDLAMLLKLAKAIGFNESRIKMVLERFL